MAITPEIDAPQAGILAVYRFAAAAIDAPQAGTMAIYNVPSKQMNATYAGIMSPYTRISRSMHVEQAGILAVVRGRIANPRVVAWPFTLDAHDFYVLRLGDAATLIYDIYSEQWIEWTYGDLPVWRVNTGMTWIGGQGLGHTHGSNVIVGDDTYGILWVLDPELPYDEHPDAANHTQQIPFDRIVTGQVLAPGRTYIPCYVLFVSGDNYGLTADDFTPEVTLEFSDDQGRNFITVDSLQVNSDLGMNNPYAWYSLGQVGSPGRIFRIIDNGLFTRIDSMSMNDDAG